MLDPGRPRRDLERRAERIKGYTPTEIIGRHFSVFYTEEDVARNHPAEELQLATRDGRYEEEGWRVRKDGTRFWANVVITRSATTTGELIGFGKVTPRPHRSAGGRGASAPGRELEAANASCEFRLLVSSVRDYAIFMLDPDGRIETLERGRRAAQGLRGATRSSAGTSRVLHRRRTARAAPAARARDRGRATAATRRRAGGSARTARSSGRTSMITAVRDADGRADRLREGHARPHRAPGGRAGAAPADRRAARAPTRSSTASRASRRTT